MALSCYNSVIVKKRSALIALSGALVGSALSSMVALAWTGPTGTPPSNNVPAPINVGSTNQVKSANIAVNGLAVFGNSLLQASSYLNWGVTAGTSGYGIRDNAGTLEFKASAGLWQNIPSIITAYFASGSNNLVGQVKFSDGTTQTTAANPVFTTTTFQDITLGQAPKTYTCPTGKTILSVSALLIPAGSASCNVGISTDNKTASYNGCNIVSGQQWFTRVICGGL